MIHAHTFKYALLAIGFGAALGACDNTPPVSETVTFSLNIQKDMNSLSCLTTGCHNATSTTKLKIDTTAGKEQANYDGLFSNQLVIKGDAANSPLIKIPSTGMTLGTPPVTHVKTLSGSKLTDWTNWVNNMAPF